MSGDSRDINRAAALDHLHRLRAQVEAVVVGVGTVIADDPSLTVRRVPGRSPARVVIDPRGRAPGAARVFAADGVRRIVLSEAPLPVAAGVECLICGNGGGPMTPSAILAALRATGLRRILIEGGARTISAFLDARALDRLHVLVSPLIIGSGRAALELAPIERLRQALRPMTSVHLFSDGDVLFDCDLRRSEGG